MHWWVTKKKPLKLDRSCACSGQLNCDPVYGDNEQPLPQGLVFRKWKDPGDKVDPVSDETCPHGLRGWTIIFHNAHPHNQNNYHPKKWWKSQEDDNRPLKETLYNYVSSHGQAISKFIIFAPLAIGSCPQIRFHPSNLPDHVAWWLCVKEQMLCYCGKSRQFIPRDQVFSRTCPLPFMSVLFIHENFLRQFTFICSFHNLRNCQLKSDVCRKPSAWI